VMRRSLIAMAPIVGGIVPPRLRGRYDARPPWVGDTGAVPPP
jgi:hypothetical protein